jgi:hypothetical protein
MPWALQSWLFLKCLAARSFAKLYKFLKVFNMVHLNFKWKCQWIENTEARLSFPRPRFRVIFILFLFSLIQGLNFWSRKKWRGTRILHRDMTFLKKLPQVSDGFRILVCRSNSEKNTSHNIIQHLYSFDINWDWTQDPKESIYSICDVDVFTAPPMYYRIIIKNQTNIKNQVISSSTLWNNL